MAEDIVGIDEWTSIITVPEDGDDRDAPSVVPAYQGLTNRSLYLLNRSGIELPGGARHVWEDVHVFKDSVGFGPGVEPIYVDDDGVPAPRQLIVPVPIFGGAGDALPFRFAGVPVGVMEIVGSGYHLYSLTLPRGSVLRSVELPGVNPTGGTSTCAITVSKTEVDFVAGGVDSSPTIIGSDTGNIIGANSAFLMAATGLAEVVNNDVTQYWILLNTSAGMRWSGLRAVVDDPGPRN